MSFIFEFVGSLIEKSMEDPVKRREDRAAHLRKVQADAAVLCVPWLGPAETAACGERRLRVLPAPSEQHGRDVGHAWVSRPKPCSDDTSVPAPERRDTYPPFPTPLQTPSCLSKGECAARSQIGDASPAAASPARRSAFCSSHAAVLLHSRNAASHPSSLPLPPLSRSQGQP